MVDLSAPLLPVIPWNARWTCVCLPAKKAASGPRVDPDPVRFLQDQLGIVPDEKQAWMLAGHHHRLLVNCSRQWGKSTITAAKVLHLMMTQPGALIVILCRVERQSALFVRKVEEFVRRLGMEVRSDGDNKVSVLLKNGSRVVGLPGTSSEHIRGFSAVTMLVVDEAARLRDPVYFAARPMVAASDGDIWALSTPLGKQGFFYNAWEHGGAAWERVAVKATECPRISAEFLEEERREMGDDWVRQEYFCEFVDLEGSVFAREVLDRAFRDEVQTLLVGK